jgi:hypothetical protein
MDGGGLGNKMRTESGVDAIESACEVGYHLRRHRGKLGQYLHQVLQEPIHSLGGRVLLSFSAHCASLEYISIVGIYHDLWELSNVLGRPDFAVPLLWLYFPMI